MEMKIYLWNTLKCENVITIYKNYDLYPKCISLTGSSLFYPCYCNNQREKITSLPHNIFLVWQSLYWFQATLDILWTQQPISCVLGGASIVMGVLVNMEENSKQINEYTYKVQLESSFCYSEKNRIEWLCMRYGECCWSPFCGTNAWPKSWIIWISQTRDDKE